MTLRRDRPRVGLVWWPVLDPLVDPREGIVEEIEVEPLSFVARRSPGGPYRFDAAIGARLAALPQRKRVHGVGTPVGGSRAVDDELVAAFVASADLVGAVAASEHLAFQRAADGSGERNALALLPPCPTDEGACLAAANVLRRKRRLTVPFAFETGVNYLRRLPGELSDGLLFRGVAEAADCGILVDLHNLHANERNGRQRVRDVLDELPLERVTEIHVAGGEERDGYWLDAHTGAIPEAVLADLADLLPRASNLETVVFEIVPAAVPRLGLRAIERELGKVRELVRACSCGRDAAPPTPPASAPPRARPVASPEAWEDALAALVIGRPGSGPLALRLADDPGFAIYRGLVAEARDGAVAALLPLTVRLLLLDLGEATARSLLAAYRRASEVGATGLDEALAFAAWLRRAPIRVEHLRSVLDLEVAQALTHAGADTCVIPFDVEPRALLAALGEGRLPTSFTKGAFEVEVPTDGTPAVSAGASAGS